MDDLISRQRAIDMVKDVCDAIMSRCDSCYDPEIGDEIYKDILEVDAILKCNKEIRIALRNMPSAQQDGKIMLDKEVILQAGYQGREVDFRIGGRLFAIREKAQ